MYDDVLEQICSMCEIATDISPTIGYLPTSGGVACYINSGYVDHVSLQKETRVEAFTVLFNIKLKTQNEALSVAETMHEALVGQLSYQQTADYTIMDIESSALPNYVGREEEYFLYAFAVQVFVNRKE